MKSKALIVFRKNPILGKVKTRIAIESDDDLALEIYNFLCKRVEEVVEETEFDIFIYYSEYLPVVSKFQYIKIQKGTDLGARMDNAFQEVLENYDSAILIGTDCPYITRADLVFAFEALKTSDVVLGPALDGGYYLIGMNQRNKELFYNIPWSSSQVLDKTVTKLKDNDLSFYQLISYSDIDRLEDWINYINN